MWAANSFIHLIHTKCLGTEHVLHIKIQYQKNETALFQVKWGLSSLILEFMDGNLLSIYHHIVNNILYCKDLKICNITLGSAFL